MNRNQLREIIRECIGELNESSGGEQVLNTLKQKFAGRGQQEHINRLAWVYLTKDGEQYGMANYERSKFEKYKETIIQKLVSTNPEAFTREFGIRDAVKKAIEARQHAVYEQK